MDSKELELLKAIQLIIDPLKSDMQNMKNDMQDMKNDMQDVKSRLTNVENEVKKTNVIIENEIRRDIRLLVEGHQGLRDRLWHLPQEVEEMKDSIEILKFTQTEMAKVVYKE